MAQYTLSYRNPRPRNRTWGDILSPSTATPTTFEQHISYLSTVPIEFDGGGRARRLAISLA